MPSILGEVRQSYEFMYAVCCSASAMVRETTALRRRRTAEHGSMRLDKLTIRLRSVVFNSLDFIEFQRFFVHIGKISWLDLRT